MNETYALSGNIVDEVGGRITRLTPDGGRYHSSRPAKALGKPLSVPFMTLSFMALLVIPPLKMSDLDLGDGDRFRLTGLFS